MLLNAERHAPAAVVFGCSGLELSKDERELFRQTDPVGFILFARNISTPNQVRDLTSALRQAVGRKDVLVMIDQEGGRVQRLRPPHWPEYPPMRPFGERAVGDIEEAAACIKLNCRLIADDLTSLGIDVNCAPVLDLPAPDGHEIIGDRAFSDDPSVIARLGQAVCDGLMAGGVMPVIKHIPGHGRATADSHVKLPHVDTPLQILEHTDFEPFRALCHAPAGMTAHVVYTAIDAENPGSASPDVIESIIRKYIGFNGLLFSDDVCMKALAGPVDVRVTSVLQAGCDVALHCNGDIDEMKTISANCPGLREDSRDRLISAKSARNDSASIDREAIKCRISAFLAK